MAFLLSFEIVNMKQFNAILNTYGTGLSLEGESGSHIDSVSETHGEAQLWL